MAEEMICELSPPCDLTPCSEIPILVARTAFVSLGQRVRYSFRGHRAHSHTTAENTTNHTVHSLFFSGRAHEIRVANRKRILSLCAYVLSRGLGGYGGVSESSPAAPGPHIRDSGPPCR